MLVQTRTKHGPLCTVCPRAALRLSRSNLPCTCGGGFVCVCSVGPGTPTPQCLIHVSLMRVFFLLEQHCAVPSGAVPLFQLAAVESRVFPHHHARPRRDGEVFGGQSVSQGFICETTNKRADTCDPTIEECSSRSSMMWCLGLVWSACAHRVPCLPKLVLF